MKKLFVLILLMPSLCTATNYLPPLALRLAIMVRAMQHDVNQHTSRNLPKLIQNHYNQDTLRRQNPEYALNELRCKANPRKSKKAQQQGNRNNPKQTGNKRRK